MRIRSSIVTILLMACLSYGCTGLTSSPGMQEPAEPKASPVLSYRPELAQGLEEEADEFGNVAVGTCLESWFSAYVRSRVVEITYELREPQSFGPWTAEEEFGTTDAREDGSLTEWANNYYIAHDWSDYGQQILSVIPGDTITVNGQSMRVDGIFNYPKDSYFDEIEELIGQDVIGFQTCYPDSDYNRIVFGAPI